MKNKITNILTFVLILISVIIILASIYYKNNFAEQDFETIFFNVLYGKNANFSIIGIGFKANIIYIFLLIILLYIPIAFSYYKNKYSRASLYSVIVLIVSIIFGLAEIGVFEYINNQKNTSTIYEEKYASNIEISFPKKKRNLIYIFLESMETTLTSMEDGGGMEYTLIPELATLAKDNINFSNTNNLGGAITVRETTCTTAGMVAQTSATPLKMNLFHNYYQSNFLPGVYSLGDILEKEGYNLEVMFGSDASFGKRKDYFKQHGNYQIFDVNTAIEQNKMNAEDKVWWGYSDDNLYLWAKEEILSLASKDKPFNFIMLTADTHFVDGYLSNNAEKKYNEQYENVFAYSSKCVSEFIEWLKEQDFYDNTTIVVIGDHIGMQTKFYKEHIKKKDYQRTVYNVFINSVIIEQNSKNRQFSTMDIFPTVLASIGAEIEGERIGLGTNLFSGKKTLIEEMGWDTFNKELVKHSEYYNKYLSGNNL